IARELNTDTVLVGTFHLAGDRILTSLSLVDAKSGLLSWAEEFEAPFEDIFHMQREIAVRAATSLKRSLTGEEEAALITPESRSVDAYDLYLQGAHLTQEGTREATDIAFGYFNQALELDRSLAEAHVGLGVVNYNRYYYGWGGGLDSLDRAEASFRKALELSPTSMRARRGLINVHYQRGHLEACLMEGREAVRLGNPHDVETLLTQATAYQLGGLAEEGAALFREVLEIDPVNQEAQWRLVTSTWLGERELIVEAGRSYLRRFGDDPEIHMFVAFAHHLLGHTERARGHYEQAVGLPARGDSTAEATAEPAALFFGGLLYEQLGEPDRATELWQLGVDIYRPRLEESPDNRRFGLILAGFYGLLGDRGSMRAIEERTLGGADWISWEVHWLALVHALRGEPDLAIELLHRALKLGLVDSSRVPAWEVYFRVADVPMPENEAFTRFVGEYRAEARRLRETY
ncbi:MAG TPA: hypothetical protein VEK15_06575, partial [Vicinamibacteria bacterium]|nr:hypothetical protein [Vicinamibacteria bacterium]